MQCLLTSFEEIASISRVEEQARLHSLRAWDHSVLLSWLAKRLSIGLEVCYAATNRVVQSL